MTDQDTTGTVATPVAEVEAEVVADAVEETPATETPAAEVAEATVVAEEVAPATEEATEIAA